VHVRATQRKNSIAVHAWSFISHSTYLYCDGFSNLVNAAAFIANNFFQRLRYPSATFRYADTSFGTGEGLFELARQHSL